MQENYNNNYQQPVEPTPNYDATQAYNTAPSYGATQAYKTAQNYNATQAYNTAPSYGAIQAYNTDPTYVPTSKYYNTPISMWGYFGYQLLFAIPCIGFICLIIFSFGGTNNINLRNFARSHFCLLIIALIIGVIIAVIMAIFTSTMIRW